MITANLLVCTSTYMLLPSFPALWGVEEGCGASLLAWGLFCVGLCLPAPFCNYWLDTYRRKSVVQWALAGIMLVMLLFSAGVPLWGRLLLRLLQGSAFTVFQIALGSTLLLDLSDTGKRTEVAHIYYWFTRLALVFGFLLSLLPDFRYGGRMYAFLSVALPFLAWLLVSTLSVPFRAPLEPVLVSLDRFWLPRGIRIFLPLFLAAFYVGMFLAGVCRGDFFICLAVGFLVALVAHQSFLRGNIQAEIIIGFVFLLFSGILRAYGSGCYACEAAANLLLGVGTGFVTSRLLLSYIRICEHCERGTAQTSYMLGWEAGLVSGFTFSVCLMHVFPASLPWVLLVPVSLAFVCYLFGLRKWYVLHRRK